MTLTKAKLVERIFKSHDLTQERSLQAAEAFLRITKACLENGEDLLLSGFGKFKVRMKKSRRGRNPQTGDEMILDARTVVTFHSSGSLREKINR